jgi:hypothetical protein
MTDSADQALGGKQPEIPLDSRVIIKVILDGVEIGGNGVAPPIPDVVSYIDADGNLIKVGRLFADGELIE